MSERALDSGLLEVLLSDKTTGGNIRWCTDGYAALGEEYAADKAMTVESVRGKDGDVVQPRMAKTVEEQLRRTRDKAEVFTPSWVCNAQNNAVDEAWFGRPDVFNIVRERWARSWVATRRRVVFPKVEGRSWVDYVDACVLESACGEAPYLTSRYDTVTGEAIPVRERIGLLDRKLRIVAENAESDEAWLGWALRAVQASYGYDYQGDNVLLARENLLCTYRDHFVGRFGEEPSVRELRKVANVIAWNVWQMDGFDNAVPFAFEERDAPRSPDMLFVMDGDDAPEDAGTMLVPVKARIYDWRARRSLTFESMTTGRKG